MNKFRNINTPATRLLALLVSATLAGCGGGSLGLSGTQGTTGAQGAQGAQGAPGAQGASGISGAQGSTGAPGVQGTQGAQSGSVLSRISGLAFSPGAPGAPVGPIATSPLLAVPLLDTYALTTSAGLTAAIGNAAGASNSATFAGDVAMDAPITTCTSIPAAAASGITPVVIGTAEVDSCGLEVGLVDSSNAAGVNLPGGLKITGSTIRYFATNSNTFNSSVRAVKTALNTAWFDAAQQAGATMLPGPGALGGLHLTPGIYKSASTMVLGSGETLTLDAFGNSNGVWLFQVGSSLTITGSTVACTYAPTTACTPTRIVLLNGAQAKNVFWQIGTPRLAVGAPLGGDVSFPAATGPIENNTVFVGSILAGNSVTFAGGTAVTGRVLAGADLLATPNTQTGGTVTTSGGSTGPVTVTLP